MIKFYWTEMLHAVSVIHKAGIIHKVKILSAISVNPILDLIILLLNRI